MLDFIWSLRPPQIKISYLIFPIPISTLHQPYLLYQYQTLQLQNYSHCLLQFNQIMKPRYYYAKNRCAISNRLDNIQQKCKRTTAIEDFETATSKPLLLEASQRYRRKTKTTREQNIFNSRQVSRSKPQMHRTFSVNHNSSKKTEKSLKKNYMSASLNYKNQSFFPTQYLGDDQRKSTVITIDPVKFFLEELYSQKIKDLKIPLNTRQRQMFISRLKSKVSNQSIEIINYDLGYNSICAITHFIANRNWQPVIKAIILDQNKIGDKGVSKLVHTLKNCCNLQTLSLASVNMGASGAQKIFNLIEGQGNLQTLNLSSLDSQSRNKIGTTPIYQLSKVFMNKQCNIRSLDISNTCIGSDGFVLLCRGLEDYEPEMEILNVSSNQIRIKEGDIPRIRHQLSTLKIKRLEVQHNLFGDMAGSLVGYLLGITYGRSQISKSNVYIDLSNNCIKSKGLESICMNLSQNHKLCQLYLSNNDLSDSESFFTIRYLLTHNWSMTKLSLRKSIRESSYLKYIGEGLDKNRSIRWLDLSDNKFNAFSLQHFFESLTENKTLRTIKFNGCEISDDHIEKSVKYIRINKCLQSLHLNNNYINSKGAKILLKVLMENRKLCELFLNKNCIDIHILKEIDFQSKQNTAFVMNEGDPDLKYYQYAEKMQVNHYNALVKNIVELEQKNKKIKMQHMEHQVNLRSEQITQKAKQIKQESKMVAYLEKKLEQQKQLQKIIKQKGMLN